MPDESENSSLHYVATGLILEMPDENKSESKSIHYLATGL